MITHFSQFNGFAQGAGFPQSAGFPQAPAHSQDAEMEVEESGEQPMHSLHSQIPAQHQQPHPSQLAPQHPQQLQQLQQPTHLQPAHLQPTQLQPAGAQHAVQDLRTKRSLYMQQASVGGKPLLDDELDDDDEDDDDDDDDAYDDDEDDDELDAQLVEQMLEQTSAENRQAIRLLLSGFSACASETVRYLIEEERMAPDSPVLLGLVQHLKMQQTMLIVSCLRTQEMFAQQQQAQQQHLQQQAAATAAAAGTQPKLPARPLQQQPPSGLPSGSQPTLPAHPQLASAPAQQPFATKMHCPRTPPLTLGQLQPLTSTPVPGDFQAAGAPHPQGFNGFAQTSRQLFAGGNFNDSGFSEP